MGSADLDGTVIFSGAVNFTNAGSYNLSGSTTVTGGAVALNGPVSNLGSNLAISARSEDHTTELQYHGDLVFCLLLEKRNGRLKLNRTGSCTGGALGGGGGS